MASAPATMATVFEIEDFAETTYHLILVHDKYSIMYNTFSFF